MIDPFFFLSPPVNLFLSVSYNRNKRLYNSSGPEASFHRQENWDVDERNGFSKARQLPGSKSESSIETSCSTALFMETCCFSV